MEITEHPFFSSMEDPHVESLQARTEVVNFADGELIFEEGSPSDTLCLVLEGMVQFRKRTPDGRDRVINQCPAGAFFGEVGIFTDSPRALSAVAAGPVRLGKIGKEQLVDFIKNTPGPIEQVLGSIVRHLHDTTRHYVDEMLHQEKMSLVGNMVNSIIHDFKNPFTMISLGAQLLEKRFPEDEKTIKICTNIHNQVDRMLVMANELAEFSRGGEQKLNFQQVNLPVFCDTFCQLNEPFFQRANVTVDIQSEPLIIEAEANKLLRVLQNLVGNAIEAFGDDKVGRVEVRIVEAEDRVVITIEDDAGGIPEQIRATLFEPFVTYGKSKGTGLGTAIVKSIVEAHHGTIDFVSEMGKGTKFTISLPKVQHPRLPH